MKNLLFAIMGFCVLAVQAQSNVNDLFAAGVEDAETFMNDYLAPVSEGAIYSIAGSWFNTGDAKPLGGFEISVIGNLTGFKNKEDKKTFVLNTADYQNLQFVDGSTSKTVSTALGDIQGIRVFVEDEVAPGITVREEFELPSGLAGEDINFIPSGYIQGSVGLIKGTELKARFLPKINTDDVAISLFGVGIQHEFTKHLPADKILPIAISGVIGYTHINGTYDFTNTSIIGGSDQRIDAKINTWVFQAVVSTKLPIINFYGSLGYLSGKSETAILGTYDVQSGPFQQTFTDPFTLEKDASGVTANVGTKLKLGFFRLHADYTLAEFNNFSFGLSFGFR
ncbi:hypothetical protein SAMN06265375_102415 [Muriicola jejuensis]|uniref:Uncharacterized protein n=1 Tax=Muriicola jejuensis TaxID=504488 RepID=A0A6P0UFE1_9FLAO|nr:DUF6588 family protein [Muriicola jejuensis]NER10609.1 hypothetical protein [Muriicola jejuensis]SMP17584.1 hypothetical protein SAMN06265375_102415 [Muriicola jejuensis]